MKFFDCILALLSFGTMMYLVHAGIWMEVPLWWFGGFAMLYGMIWSLSSLLILYHPTAVHGTALMIAGKPKQKDEKKSGRESSKKQKKIRIGRFEIFNTTNRIILFMFIVWIGFSLYLVSGNDNEDNPLIFLWLFLCIFVVLRTRIGFGYFVGFARGFVKGLSQGKKQI